MIRVSFRSTPTVAVAKINDMTRRLLHGDELVGAMVTAHGQIERLVKGRLLDLNTKTGDATKTSPSGFNRAEQVAANITSAVVQTGTGLIGGVGRRDYMDQNDPILKIRSVKNDQIRLWKILEVGVKPFSGTLKAKDPNKPMLFFWKKRSTFFVGKSKNWRWTALSGSPVTGQAMVGRAPYDEAINHPGQLGRFYWEKSMIDSENAFVIVMTAALKLIVET